MTLNQVQNVVDVAKFDSISKAARILELPQSHLSSSISSLEEELGVKLFQRSKDGIILTESGESFLFHAQNILENYHALLELKDNERVERFSVAAPPMSFCTEAFAGLCKLYETSESLRFSMQSHINERAMPLLQTGDLDLAIMLVPDSKRYQIYELCQQKKIKLDFIGALPVNVYVRQGHPLLKHCDPEDKAASFPFSDLSHYPCVDYTEAQHGFTLRSTALGAFHAQSIGNSEHVILLSERTQKDCVVLSTNAYSIGVARSKSQEHPELVNIPLPDCFFDLYFATSLSKPSNRLVREYRTLLIEVLSKSPEFLRYTLTSNEAHNAENLGKI